MHYMQPCCDVAGHYLLRPMGLGSGPMHCMMVLVKVIAVCPMEGTCSVTLSTSILLISACMNTRFNLQFVMF